MFDQKYFCWAYSQFQVQRLGLADLNFQNVVTPHSNSAKQATRAASTTSCGTVSSLIA
jgi:hypothetical protein